LQREANKADLIKLRFGEVAGITRAALRRLLPAKHPLFSAPLFAETEDKLVLRMILRMMKQMLVGACRGDMYIMSEWRANPVISWLTVVKYHRRIDRNHL